MKLKLARRSRSGFTMAEILIGVSLLTGVGIACYSMLLSSSILFAKNVSLNTSNTILRTALDRMYNDINQGYGMPKLINADGSAATTQSAAGITFDLYLGGPYVVTNPGATGLPASTIQFQMKHYSADTLTAQPLPVTNDVIVLDNGITRPVINTCTSSTASNVRTLTVNLKSALGTSVSWNASTTKTAALVHKRAYVLANINNQYGELRLYNNAEAGTDFANPANYVVLTRELSGTTGEDMPFSIVPDPLETGTNLLSITMRVESQNFNKSLALKQSKEFNTFLRLDTRLRPRN
jgi:hypothetical protein